MFKRTLLATAMMAITTLGGQGLPATAAQDPAGEFSIMNGVHRQPGDFPEVVLLKVPHTSDSRMVGICGGTIIDDRWILTAAHCFPAHTNKDATQVEAFTPYGIGIDNVQYPTLHQTKRVYLHPKYQEEELSSSPEVGSHKGRYDVALIELNTPISAGTPMKREALGYSPVAPKPGVELKVPKVSLARAGEELPRSGQSTVVGRGAYAFEITDTVHRAGKEKVNTEQLRSADVPLKGDCDTDYMVCAEDEIDHSTLGALPVEDRHGAAHRAPSSCVGDSGGPLFVTDSEGKRRQIGIVSHSRFSFEQRTFWENDLCGRVKTWYASVSFLRPWITHVMNANLGPSDPVPHIHLALPPYDYAPPVHSPSQPPATSAPVPPPSAPAPAPSNKPSQAPAPQPDEPGALPSRPNDPAALKNLPAPSNGPMTWVLPSGGNVDGSALAIGVSRLRDGFKQLKTKSTSPASAKIALLASNTKMADALASGVLQQDASLYLTDPENLSIQVLDELKANGVAEVWLLGGPKAIGQGVENALKLNGFNIRRIAGADRIQTAVAIANAQSQRKSATPKSRYIARAFGDQGDETRSWADSIALGGLAAKTGTPVLLTDSHIMSDSIKEQLRGGVDATLIGGNAAVSPFVADQIETYAGMRPNRIAGQNRADTAGQIAHNFEQPKRAIIIDGQNRNAWQLGFSLAGLSNDLNAPILLTAGNVIPPETKQALKDLSLENVICMGELEMCEAVTEATGN